MCRFKCDVDVESLFDHAEGAALSEINTNLDILKLLLKLPLINTDILVSVVEDYKGEFG